MKITTILHNPFGEHDLFALILSTLATLIMMIIFGHFIYHDVIKQSKSLGIKKYQFWKLQPHSIVAGLALFWYLFYGIHSLLLAVYGTFFVNLSGSFYAPYCLGHYHHNWGLFLGKTFMYIFWFVRFAQDK